MSSKCTNLILFAAVCVGGIHARPTLFGNLQNSNPGSSGNQGSNIFSNFAAGNNGNLFGANGKNFAQNLNAFLGNLTLPGGQNATLGFTNLFTLLRNRVNGTNLGNMTVGFTNLLQIITNFMKGQGAKVENLFKNANFMNWFKNVTGSTNSNRGLFGNFQNSQTAGNSGGAIKIGTTNLLGLLTGALGNTGSKVGSSSTGSAQGSSSNFRGGLLGGFTGTQNGGIFNLG